MLISYRKLHTISITLAALMLASISTRAEAAPASHKYYLVFTDEGQTSRGDVVADRNAIIIGEENSAVATGADGLSIVKGGMTLITHNCPVWFAFQDNNGVTVSEHSKIEISKEDKSYVVKILAGEATIRAGKTSAALTRGTSTNVSAEDWRWETQSVSDTNSKDLEFPRKQSPVRLLAMDGSKFSVKDNALLLKDGAVFAQIPGGTEVRTPTGNLRCAKPYSVSFRTVRDALCLENCSSQTLTLGVRGESIKMFPYNSCVVRHVGPELAEMPNDGVMRRNAIAKSDGSLTAIVSEYDPETLLDVHPPLKAALAHPITTNEQKTFFELFKGIAILDQLADRNTFTDAPKINNEMLGYFKSPIPYDPEHAKKAIAGKLATRFSDTKM